MPEPFVLPKVLQGAWAEFLANAVPQGASAHQIETLRRTYCSGASFVFQYFVARVAKAPEKDAAMMIVALRREFLELLVELVQAPS